MNPADILTLRRLFRNPWRPPAELEALQLRGLGRLLRRADRAVPYYRRLFDAAGVRPDQIRCLEDLRRIPLTTKAALQAQPLGDITAADVDLSRCVQTRTSGSLGMPLVIYQRRRDKDFLDLVWARAKLANGQRLGDRVLTLREPGHDAAPAWFQRLGIWPKHNIPCRDDRLLRLEDIGRWRPDVISAFPSSLLILDRALKRDGRSLRPRLIFTSAELLTAGTREAIEQAFGAPVCDCYGTAETGLIAWQCPERADYHINADSVIVEWEGEGRPAPPGTRGLLVCTVLRSFAMPFIRYVIGDIGIAGGKPCSCGRTLPVMRVVEGRHADCLTLPDGRVVSPYVVTCAIERVRGVAQYQVVQDAPAELEVRLAGGPGAAVRQAVRDALAAALGPGLSVRVTPCDALRPEPGGKYRVVMSRVGAPHIALVRCSSAGYGLEPGITEVPCS